MGSSPRGRKELDTTERLSLTQSLGGGARGFWRLSLWRQAKDPRPAGPWAWERPCSILGPPAQASLALPPPSGSWRVGEPSASQGGMTCSQWADASPGDQAGMADLWSCSKAGEGLGGPGLGLLGALER